MKAAAAAQILIAGLPQCGLSSSNVCAAHTAVVVNSELMITACEGAAAYHRRSKLANEGAAPDCWSVGLYRCHRPFKHLLEMEGGTSLMVPKPPSWKTNAGGRHRWVSVSPSTTGSTHPRKQEAHCFTLYRLANISHHGAKDAISLLEFCFWSDCKLVVAPTRARKNRRVDRQRYNFTWWSKTTN